MADTQLWPEIEGEIPKLYRTALVMTGNPQDAEDLVQEVALAAIVSFPGFRSEAKLSTWMTTILINQYRMARRRQAVRVRSAARVPVDRPDPFPSQPESKEACELLREAI